jgi:hypothetical protein
MSKHEPRQGHVFVTIELPVRIIEIVSNHGSDLIHVIEAIAQKCRHLPPSAETQAKVDKRREQKSLERAAQHKALGRRAFRLLRHRVEVDSYTTSYGKVRSRDTQTRQQWRNDILSDIAGELCADKLLVEIVTTRFRKELLAKIKPRRNRAITRLYHEGASDKEIAARVNLHPLTINRFIRGVIKPAGRRT